MPKEVNIWQRTTTNVDPGYVQCPDCEGWGVHGMRDGPGTADCTSCFTQGQVLEQYADILIAQKNLKEARARFKHRVTDKHGNTKEMTTAELKREGWRDTQFGWTDRPMGNTD